MDIIFDWYDCSLNQAGLDLAKDRVVKTFGSILEEAKKKDDAMMKV